ncbi:hypothetical protein DFH28DRAFT_923419 [Melampsora americana]|nr:hypothetical protein DFH28DRAFT_923419 [Melampsora americana]
MNQLTKEDTPTSSQPPSPHQTPTPFLTPLTFQVHPLALQALQLNSASPTFYSGPIRSGYLAPVLQPGAFGSSFGLMTPVCQQNAPLLENNPKKSKTPAKSRKGKSRSLSTQKTSTSKIPKAKTPSARKQVKCTTTTGTDESSNDASNPAATQRPRWEDDKNEQGESAMSLLLKWITTYGNWP